MIYAVVRPELEKLALTARKPLIRQVGFVALINVDGAVDKVREQASPTVNSLRDLLTAMPLIADPSVRAGLYPKVEPLLTGLPANLAPQLGSGKEVAGRYVRIELRGSKKTLSLAEVEVFSNGQNIARKGKASQKDTSNGGDANRAIDGITDGRFTSGTVSHTMESTSNPWWQVDLGAEFPIDQIVVLEPDRRQPGQATGRLYAPSSGWIAARRLAIGRQPGAGSQCRFRSGRQWAGRDDSPCRHGSPY